MFEDNKIDPDIEPIFNDLKDEDPDTWNVVDDPEEDTKLDINKPRAIKIRQIVWNSIIQYKIE